MGGSENSYVKWKIGNKNAICYSPFLDHNFYMLFTHKIHIPNNLLSQNIPELSLIYRIKFKVQDFMIDISSRCSIS